MAQEKELFDAGPNAQFVVDEANREYWAKIGVTDKERQDKIFRSLAAGVARITTDWHSGDTFDSETHQE